MGDSERTAVCKHVYSKHPGMKGVRPKMSRQGSRRVYTFSKSVAASPGGPKINQIVRATVDDGGRIIKVVASR